MTKLVLNDVFIAHPETIRTNVINPKTKEVGIEEAVYPRVMTEWHHRSYPPPPEMLMIVEETPEKTIYRCHSVPILQRIGSGGVAIITWVEYHITQLRDWDVADPTTGQIDFKILQVISDNFRAPPPLPRRPDPPPRPQYPTYSDDWWG